MAHLASGDTTILLLGGAIAQGLGTLIRLGTWLALFTVLLTGGSFGRLLWLGLLGPDELEAFPSLPACSSPPTPQLL